MNGKILYLDSMARYPALFFALLLFGAAGLPPALAGPTGGTVVGGAGSINQSGANTTIQQTSQNMAIDWQSYNVNANERVQYIQPNSSSISLNRILSQNGSTIAGRVDANGQVILVNPNGIFFTPTSIINVGGIIASGLNIQPTDFMNGNYIFDEVLGTEGTVINSGMINASLGGNVALIGKQVENDGLIVANLGSVNLAAGKQAVLTFDQGGLLGVRVSKEILQDELGVDPAVLNSGEINAEGGRVLLTASTSQDVFSQAVNTGSLDQPLSVVMHEDGSFTLGAGADVMNIGSVDVSTVATMSNTGRIVLLGENVTSSGELRADAKIGNGGEIELHAQDTTLLTENSITSARSENEGRGGMIKVLGDNVGLFDQSIVDASGANGGGQVFIGGDQEGNNPLIPNAAFIYLSQDSQVFADALDNGDGGRLITFAADTARIYGDLFARGGSNGGNGGFIETSGLRGFEINSVPDTTAASGQGGTWLIDPYSITINNNAIQNVTQSGDEFTSTGTPAEINVTAIRDTLDNGSTVIVRTGSGGPGAGDIIFDAELNYNGRENATLTLDALGDINFINSSEIFDSNPTNNNSQDALTLNLYARGNVAIGTNVSISTQGGDFVVGNPGNGIIPTGFTNNGTINTAGVSGNAGGNVTLFTSGAVNNTATGSITTGGGDFSVGTTSNRVTRFTHTGTITTTGAFNQNGGDIAIYTSGSLVSSGLTAEGGDTGTSGSGVTNRAGRAGGNIMLDAASVEITGTISAIGSAGTYDTDGSGNNGQNGGNGGSVMITASNGDVSVDAINTSGGEAAGDYTGTINTSDGGDAGTIALTVGESSNINLGGNLTAAGARGYIEGSNGRHGNGNSIDLNGNTMLQSSVVMDISGATDATVNTSGGYGNVTFNGSIAGTTDRADNLTITADAMTFSGGIATETVRLGTVNLSAENTINAGSFDIYANTINVTQSTDFTAGTLNTANIGNTGGNINITADQITLNDDLDASGTTSGNINLTLSTAGSVTLARTTDFASAVTLTGSAGTDTLNAANRENIWSLTAADSTLNTNVTFSNIETLVGNAQTDTFILPDTDTFTGTLSGGGGGNILQAGNRMNDWTVIGDDTGTVTGLSEGFTDIETLTGGTDIDTFDITAAYSGNINGGDNTDIFNIGADVSGTITGGQGDDTFTVTAATSGLLQGDDNNDTFNLSANISGGASGGQGNDTFNIQTPGITFTGTLNGDGGTDTLTAANESNYWTVSDTNQGEIYSDPNRTSQNQRLAFSTIENLTGGTGLDDVLMDTNGSIININGNTGSNTLTGRNANNTWTISTTGNNLATANNSTYVTAFTNINTLAGGSLSDEFTVNNNSTIGNLQGQAGNDTFTIAGTVGSIATGDDTASTNTVTINTNGAVTGTITGGNGKDNIIINTGGTAGSILTGDNTDTVFLASPGVITTTTNPAIDGGNGEDTLTVNTLNNTWAFTTADQTNGSISNNNIERCFSGFETLTSATGSTDTQDYSRLTGSININLSDLSGIGTLIGNYGTADAGTMSSITARDNTTNDWQIGEVIVNAQTTDGLNDGTVFDGTTTIIFENFNALTGGNGNDTFTITGETGPGPVNGTFDGILDGNGGTNTLNARNNTNNTWTINATNSTLAYTGTDNSPVTSTFNGIQNIAGGNLTDTFTVNAAINNLNTGNGDNRVTVNSDGNITGMLTGGTGIDTIEVIGSANTINTGDNNDIITVSGTGSISGVIDGGSSSGGNDTLTINSTNDRIVQLGNAVLNNGEDYTVTNIEIINATTTNNTAGNTLRGDAGNSIWQVTADNGGTVSDVSFSNFANLEGNTGTDEFTINAAIGNINAGNGDNRITVNSDGNVTGTIIGGTGIDTIEITGRATTISTGDNNDLITVSGTGSISGVIDGGDNSGGNDTLTINSTNDRIVQLGNAVLNNGEDYTVTNIEIINGTTTNNIVGNTLRGDAGNNIWQVNTDNGGTVSGINFSNFANLEGNTGTDEFTVNAAIRSINAGNGDNRITVNSDGNVTGTIIGGTGIDTVEIIGRATTISTGDNNDLITVSGTGSISGVIDGGGNSGGNDTLTINSTNDRIVQLGNAVPNNGEDYTVTNIEVINAATMNNTVGNTLRADANTNTWLVNVDNGGTVSGVSFSNFANLEGNTGTDDFTVNAAIRNINAGNGNNTITVNGGGNVSDAITSGTGMDVIGISGNANTISTGNGNDRITVSGTVTGIIDGGDDGTGIGDSLMVTGVGDQIVQLGNTDLNNGENYTAWNIETINASGTTGNTMGNTLRADTGSNTWTIDGMNSGDISNATSATTTVFLNFANLTGNTATDAFTISAPSGNLTGLINGMAGSDSLSITSGGNITVQLGNVVNSNLNVFRVETITANPLSTNTLIGNSIPDPAATAENPVDYIWRITGDNSGNVTGNNESTTFSNFKNLYGGTAVDQFTVTPTGAIGLTDMGAGNDFFTINGNANAVGTAQTVDGNSGDDTFTVAGGTVASMIGGDGTDTIVDTSEVVNITVGIDVGGFEGITAQNGAGIINAQNNVQSDWLINELNTGSVSVNGNTGQRLVFSGFSMINGGSGVDNFTVIENGEVSGTVNGGGGNDTLLIDLPDNTARTAAGQIYFDGGDGTDRVTITGASNVYREIYNPDINVNDNNYDQLRYINNENASITFDVNYQQAETINDNIQTTSLTINSAGNGDMLTLGDNTFGYGAGSDAVIVNYMADRETDIIVQASNGSNLNLTDNIRVNGDLTITADAINQAASTTVTANRLILDGTNQAETTTNRLTTDVNELAIMDLTGSIVIDEQDDIVLTDISSTTGSIDITTAAGAITSEAELITSGTLNLNAGNNDITLSGENQLSGKLTLFGSSIIMNNTTATRLAGVAAQNLTITSTGSITDADAFNIQIDNTAILTSDGDIILDNDSNNFNIVELNARNGDATVIDTNGIVLTDTTVGGALSVTANNGLAANEISTDNNMALGTITAATIDLNANEGAIVSQSSDLTVTADAITLAAASGIGTGGGNGRADSDADSVRGAITTNTTTLSVINASFESADERSGAANVNVMTTSGTININNAGNVTVNDLRNNGNITLTNAGNITLNITDSSGAIDANYGGNISDARYAGDVTLSARGNNVSTLGIGTLSGNADIIAESLYVRNVSRFGTRASPIGLRVNSDFDLLARQGVVYYLGRSPDTITTTADLLQLAIRGFIGISSQHLVNIENLSEIDPAIFTEVRNYNYDDLSIRLPADQNYGDDDDEKENGEEGEEKEG